MLGPFGLPLRHGMLPFRQPHRQLLFGSGWRPLPSRQAGTQRPLQSIRPGGQQWPCGLLGKQPVPGGQQTRGALMPRQGMLPPKQPQRQALFGSGWRPVFGGQAATQRLPHSCRPVGQHGPCGLFGVQVVPLGQHEANAPPRQGTDVVEQAHRPPGVQRPEQHWLPPTHG